jgi:hypothetical protein
LGISYNSKSSSCYGVAPNNRIFTFLTDREFAFEDACGQKWRHTFHRLLPDSKTTWVDIDIFKRGEEE